MTLSRRQLLVLLPAAATAWKFVLAGTPEAAPNFNASEHWWGMLTGHHQVYRLRELRPRMRAGKRCS